MHKSGHITWTITIFSPIFNLHVLYTSILLLQPKILQCVPEFPVWYLAAVVMVLIFCLVTLHIIILLSILSIQFLPMSEGSSFFISVQYVQWYLAVKHRRLPFSIHFNLQSYSCYDGIPGSERGCWSHANGSHPHEQVTWRVQHLLQERRYSRQIFYHYIFARPILSVSPKYVAMFIPKVIKHFHVGQHWSEALGNDNCWGYEVSHEKHD